MTTPKLENKMSIGNILNLLALVVAVAVGWGVMSERGEHNRTEMNDIKETLRQEVSTAMVEGWMVEPGLTVG